MAGSYCVYILASKRNGTLYIGVTNDLLRRVWEHQNDICEGFTKKYGVHRLVWYEEWSDIGAAIAREKRLKKWNRAWKIALIEKKNPGWSDLYWRLIHPVRPLSEPSPLLRLPEMSSPASSALRAVRGKGDL